MNPQDRANEQLRDLQKVTDATLAYLPLEGLLQELLGRVVEILNVDTAVVLLLEDDERTLVPRAAIGLEEEVERGIRIPVGRGFAGRIVARGEGLRLTDLEHVEIVNPVLRKKGLRSLLGIPLVVEGRVIGVLHVGSLVERVFTDGDVELLQRAGDRAALGIHGRMTDQERGLATAVQRSLIPTLPDVPGVSVVGSYLPAAEARVGGDWYDAFPLPGGVLALAIGDVVGHGFHAAALMGQLRSGLRAYAMEGSSPSVVLERLSGLLRELGPRRSATLLYLVTDPQAGRVLVASAGHPPPLVVEAEGGAHLVEIPGSVPLGAVRNPSYADVELHLEPGSALLLYTDGLVERPGEPLDAGLARLVQAVRDVDRDPEALRTDVLHKMLPEGPARDDVALLIARALPLADPLELRVPATIDAIPLLRRVLARWLVDAGASESTVEDLSLAFAEACANAAEHAYSPAEGMVDVHATMSDDGKVVVSVRDYGSWRAPRGEHRGRGLGLMEGLTDSVEVVRGDDGTTVRLSRQIEKMAA
jgi:anti-sigma regulatory factor (Ser/Thr protein kinase)/putative methionine-R-sulfoxide reductase with GAF domain